MKKILAMALTIAMALSVCSINAFAASTEHDIAYTMEYTGRSRDDVVDLCALVAEELEYEFRQYDIVVDPYDVLIDIDNTALKYGYIGSGRADYGYYTLDLTDSAYDELMRDGYVCEVDIAYEVEDDYFDFYYGDIELTIAIYNNNLEYELSGDTEFELGKALADDLDSMTTKTLNFVEFELDEDNDCGDLYIYDPYYDEWDDFDERDVYYYLPENNYDYDLEDLIFEHDGTEGEFLIYYTAYDMNNSKILEGTITIVCSGALYLEASITNEEVYTFDSAVFQDAVDEWDDDYTLVYIDNVKLADSKDGVLYYDYDEDSRRNSEISSRSEYYVDDDEIYLLDYITFVPASDLKDTVTIHFDAYVEKSRSDDMVAGVLQINVDQAADITINAGVDEEVEIDYDLFQEYLEEDLNSYNYDVAYVTISNAPRSKDAGYLVTDDEELTTRGDKTFYMDATKNQYSLKDLYYKAGSKKGTYSATFTVYYYRSSNRNASAATKGTIDFIVGESTASTSLSGTIKASEIMNFASSLSAFEALGGNDNEYIVFTSLPVGGKLVSGWGTSSQEDVKIGTAYYLSYMPSQKLLSSVTFVPSYSSSKLPKTITIGVKGYDKNNKSVTGSINIGVSYASYSGQFTDITTSTYADSVDFLYNQKITTGMTNTTFGPNNNVTRAQFVTFLWRAAGSPIVYGTNQFTDVKNSGEYAYAYNAILWAVQNNITTGRSATKFDPSANVTHQELLTFLYRYDVMYLGHSGTRGSITGFYDYQQVAEWAELATEWAANKGILTGNTIQPTTAGTRATVALWLHRMLTL